MIADPGAQVVLPHPERLRRMVREWFALWQVEEHFGRVRIAWSQRLSTGAGRAHLDGGKILLNPRLLARVPAEIPAVLAHEAAHLAVWWRYGPAVGAHGKQWQLLMKQAGFPAQACHAYPVEGLRRRQYYWLHLCVGCGARSIRRAAARLVCRACGPSGRIVRLRAPRDRAGLAKLKTVSAGDVRAAGALQR